MRLNCPIHSQSSAGQQGRLRHRKAVSTSFTTNHATLNIHLFIVTGWSAVKRCPKTIASTCEENPPPLLYEGFLGQLCTRTCLTAKVLCACVTRCWVKGGVCPDGKQTFPTSEQGFLRGLGTVSCYSLRKTKQAFLDLWFSQIQGWAQC